MERTPRIRMSYTGKLFVSHLLAVFLVSGSVGSYFFWSAHDNLMRSLQSRLKNSAAMVSQSIDARTLENISSAEDVNDPAYIDSLAKLRRVRRSNPDIAFLYVMRLTGDAPVFVVDSDETEAQALPGRLYEDAKPELMMGFTTASVDEHLTEDEWGIFLSGYAPLLQGDGTYLVGVDMRADEVKNKMVELRLAGIISLLASTLLALLFALALSRGLSRRVHALVNHCRRLTLDDLDARVDGRTYDEFDDLADAFNQMGDRLSVARGRLNDAIQSLKESQSGLEERVAERTGELEDALSRMNVLRGLLPICCVCKNIRDDQGYWQRVERFVTERSEVRFTHGICPDCSVKLYGDLMGADNPKIDDISTPIPATPKPVT